MSNLNILSKRYATKRINEIFSQEGTILAYRELWIAVMKAQKKLGVNIPSQVIEKYQAAKGNIDLDRIREIEKITKHDVKANIEAYVAVAKTQEHLHKGMTSRDLTDNVEEMQVKKASKIIFGKYLAVLKHLTAKAKEYQNTVFVARTHHQPAQPTLLGRRFSMWAEELLFHLKSLERFIDDYPFRGIKGPVGTQFDMLTLLGSKAKVEKLEKTIANELGFSQVLHSPGQIYPRSLDYDLITRLSLLGSACANFAKGMRLMAGAQLVTEGFKKGQVGSSSMPHKMNTRSSERICGFAELLKMYADGASRLSGDQWEEGDVSCSVVRRVIIPDSFYASDGICETILTVLGKMGAYPTMLSKEVDKYLPFLATTEILMMGVKAGIGREKAHEIIKKYAIQEVLAMRQSGSDKNNLARVLTGDPLFKKAGIGKDQIAKILSDKLHFVGNAQEQITRVCTDAEKLIKKYPKEAKYKPGDIL